MRAGMCAGLPKEPEGEEEWFCPVCKVSKTHYSLSPITAA